MSFTGFKAQWGVESFYPLLVQSDFVGLSSFFGSWKPPHEASHKAARRCWVRPINPGYLGEATSKGGGHLSLIGQQERDSPIGPMHQFACIYLCPGAGQSLLHMRIGFKTALPSPPVCPKADFPLRIRNRILKLHRRFEVSLCNVRAKATGQSNQPHFPANQSLGKYSWKLTTPSSDLERLRSGRVIQNLAIQLRWAYTLFITKCQN